MLLQGSIVKGKSAVTLNMREKCKNLGYFLIPGQKLCINCSSTLYTKLKDKNISLTDLVTSSPSIQSGQGSQQLGGEDKDSDFQLSLTPSFLENINTFLEKHNETAIDLQKLKTQTGYLTLQLEKFQRVFCACANLPVPSCDIAKWEKNSELFEEFISQLHGFIKSSLKTSEVVMAISVLPRFWPSAQIHSALGVSIGFVRKVKSLVDVKGMFVIFYAFCVLLI